MRRLCAIALVGMLCAGAGTAWGYNIGVYYYPGWSPGARGPDPWAAIKPYPKLEPKLGWYRDGSTDTLETQLQWMRDYGIRFVVFDWFWHGGGPKQEQSLEAYLRAPSRKDVPFALLWANHWRMHELKDFDAMTRYWVREYLTRPEYLRVDDKPVVFVFSPDLLVENAQRMGTTGTALLERARAEAAKAGLKGIYFVMATPAVEFWAKGMAPKLGFDALSAYNYHHGFNGTPESRTRPSFSFDELDKNYRMNWQWLVKNAPLPYIVPITAGWDKSPWGGSGDRRHDQSTGSADEFETHLLAARQLMDAQPEKTRRMGVICCWNEFGEGSVIEPTKGNGFSFLERVQKVFGAKQP